MKKNLSFTWNIDDYPINFPVELRPIYEKTYIKNRKFYTNWNDKIGKKYKKDIDWWVSLPSFRNPYVNDLLNYTTVLDTIKLIKFDQLKILTKSKQMSNVINSNFSSNKINAEFNGKNNFLEKINNFFKSTLFQIIIYFYINIFIEKFKPNSSKKIILVDAFVTSKKNQNLNFYNGLKNVKNSEILIVPTFVPTLNFVRLFRLINHLNTKEKKYMFKEHYLKISDIFYSFLHILRRKKFLKEKFKYKKINVSKIMHEKINNFNDFYSINIGILNYKFFFRLSENKINIFKSINWFENQIIDKGWNLGFRTFFEKFEKNSFGYQDFNRHYNLISNSASPIESSSKVTPEKVIVISKLFTKIAREFFKKQKVIIGETWRFKNLLKYKCPPPNKKNKILLALCGLEEIDKILLKLVIGVCNSDKSIKIIVKAHPILDVRKIIPNSDLPENLIVSNENLQTNLHKSFISITAGPSSVLLESVCMGVFVILPEIESGTKENAKIFKAYNKRLFMVKNTNELLNKINYLKKNKNKLKIKKQNLINFNSKNLVDIN